ncbi:hypothetical protein WN944_028882 [Citrus x changshan-huyou]|uniref:Uncharacterized protein n=1 Tax=Citrus x changshan-huyou TaxID=2935761 RepID=A0AAP0LLD5_9ROSI
MAIKLPSQNNLVIGRVKILKRGEAVLPPSLMKKEDASEKQITVCSSNVESDNVDFVAGMAFFSSPPPSTVPLPRFLAINPKPHADNGIHTTAPMALLLRLTSSPAPLCSCTLARP